MNNTINFERECSCNFFFKESLIDIALSIINMRLFVYSFGFILFNTKLNTEFYSYIFSLYCPSLLFISQNYLLGSLIFFPKYILS